ncbi:hypothetical protein CS304_10275 [Lactiplantibacillus plantarum]|nr:hypothetical protein HMPREF0531_11704 [Lactiplantibacillus plantarum subsp. plantarum ATCC 14917 = JCM 1149 = CGMCC 1.2437]MED7643274.1 hypothetical protein [Lactiplantibacillus plantarum]GEL34662.1 hypothetical protein LPL02_24010 [Lactiplantibacillus plantarum subsp. plantarum]PHV52513.1 hypothetical protein CSZ93_14165 [Lactiplantibacillus plantarum]PHY16491.1 hypothetical protein CS305_04395 [Lactiplantibacillus plantarum]
MGTKIFMLFNKIIQSDPTKNCVVADLLVTMFKIKTFCDLFWGVIQLMTNTWISSCDKIRGRRLFKH